jgi:hypothetical protein
MRGFGHASGFEYRASSPAALMATTPAAINAPAANKTLHRLMGIMALLFVQADVKPL